MLSRKVALIFLVMVVVMPATRGQTSTSNQSGGVIEPPNGQARSVPSRNHNTSSTQPKPPLTP